MIYITMDDPQQLSMCLAHFGPILKTCRVFFFFITTPLKIFPMRAAHFLTKSWVIIHWYHPQQSLFTSTRHALDSSMSFMWEFSVFFSGLNHISKRDCKRQFFLKSWRLQESVLLWSAEILPQYFKKVISSIIISLSAFP